MSTSSRDDRVRESRAKLLLVELSTMRKVVLGEGAIAAKMDKL